MCVRGDGLSGGQLGVEMGAECQQAVGRLCRANTFVLDISSSRYSQ